VIVTGLVIGYGFWSDDVYSTNQKKTGKEAGAKVLLLQGTRDVRFGLTAKEYQKEEEFHFAEHQKLIVQGRKDHGKLDLVDWPESMYPAADYLPLKESKIDTKLATAGLTTEGLGIFQRNFRIFALNAAGFGTEFETPVPQLVGCRTIHPGTYQTYNAAVFINEQNQIAGRYYKTHLVPFGEYLPLGETFPSLYQLAPMESSLTVGHGATPLEVGDRRILPVICFESMMGNFIRQYFLKAKESGIQNHSPDNRNPQSNVDAMVTLTNDGWYYGSSALDLHLAANVFRAVENRTSHLIAANTGLSAEISPTGRILQSVPRRTAGSIYCTVDRRDPRWHPLWWTVGNSPWFGLTILSVLLFGASRTISKGKENPEP